MIRQGVILVGGLGTRLRALGFDRPKPLIEVAGRPFVEHVVAHLSAFGIRQVVLLSGYRGDQVREAYDGRALFGCALRVLTEPEPRGTLGALGFAGAALDETFLLANGDSIFLADLAGFVSTPLRAGAAGRLLLRDVEDAARYGAVELAADGRVIAFAEKAAGAGRPGLINAGVYLLDRDAVLAGVRPGSCSLEADLFPAWAAAGRLDGMRQAGYFIDIGVPDSYREATATLGPALRRPAAFLDRDGVINVDAGYTYRIEDLAFTPTAVDGIGALNRAGYRVIVVSNQAGVARGLFEEAHVHAFHAEMQRRLLSQGAHIDAFYHCPYHPDGVVPAYARHHEDRKPGAGMLLRAMREWPVRPAGSFLIGDKATDIEAAQAAGLPGYQVVADSCDLAATVRHILAREGGRS